MIHVFSSRLKWHLPQNPLSALLEAKRRAGVRVLDLTESNPTRAGFDYPGERILGALSDSRGLLYQPDPRGLESAREAVASYYRHRGVEVSPARILLTASTSEAYGYLFKLLADPGCQILTPRPSYPLFEYLAALESVEVVQYPLRYDGAWHIDFPALENGITPRARAIVVVNPNNPTGSFLKREELERLESLAVERGLAILSDEVFADYTLSADADRVTTLVDQRRALAFSMSGLSKIAGLPQMKLGWIVVGGPQADTAADTAMDRLELIADTYLSVATPVQRALAELLEASAGVHSQIIERTSINLAHLRSTLAGSPAGVLNVEGGWYAIVQVPRTRSEEQWALELLGEHDVLVQPGFFYDFETEAFLVVSLLTPPEEFTEALRRLRSVL
jgi:alanine-synthesizing transaminase